MTNELTYLRIICIFFILIVVAVKYLLWANTKKENRRLRTFLYYFFTWFSVYSMYDNQDFKPFMKANNYTNLFMWAFAAILCVSFLI